jgi:hypothetical protein
LAAANKSAAGQRKKDRAPERLLGWIKRYENDFVEEQGSVRQVIKMYADDYAKEKVKASNRIRHIDYNWSLNKPDNFPGFQMVIDDS